VREFAAWIVIVNAAAFHPFVPGWKLVGGLNRCLMVNDPAPPFFISGIPKFQKINLPAVHHQAAIPVLQTSFNHGTEDERSGVYDPSRLPNSRTAFATASRTESACVTSHRSTCKLSPFTFASSASS